MVIATKNSDDNRGIVCESWIINPKMRKNEKQM